MVIIQTSEEQPPWTAMLMHIDLRLCSQRICNALPARRHACMMPVTLSRQPKLQIIAEI